MPQTRRDDATARGHGCQTHEVERRHPLGEGVENERNADAPHHCTQKNCVYCPDQRRQLQAVMRARRLPPPRRRYCDPDSPSTTQPPSCLRWWPGASSCRAVGRAAPVRSPVATGRRRGAGDGSRPSGVVACAFFPPERFGSFNSRGARRGIRAGMRAATSAVPAQSRRRPTRPRLIVLRSSAHHQG